MLGIKFLLLGILFAILACALSLNRIANYFDRVNSKLSNLD